MDRERGHGHFPFLSGSKRIDPVCWDLPQPLSFSLIEVVWARHEADGMNDETTYAALPRGRIFAGH